MIPKNYRGNPLNYDESITLGKFPTFQWSSDSYTNWLTQNAVSLTKSTFDTAFNVGQNMYNSIIPSKNDSANVNKGDLLISNTKTISDYLFNIYDANYRAGMIPNRVSGTNTGNVAFSNQSLNYEIMRMRPKTEYLKRIDDFFSRFGYKTNQIKIPNITGRAFWNYVEIGSSEIIGTGEIPARDMDNINNIFRRGVTIWHSHDNIGNYNLDNKII